MAKSKEQGTRTELTRLKSCTLSHVPAGSKRGRRISTVLLAWSGPGLKLLLFFFSGAESSVV